MKLLILGGTEFAGRAVAGEGLSRGWQVTVFNRGSREAPPGVTALRGDRTAPDGLASLDVGEWDVVVDTWSGAPTVVRDAARLLAGRAERYAYVSSRSVYVPPGKNEDAAVVEASPDTDRTEYAKDKRGAELAAIDAFGDRALLVRAGLILGPHENVGRLPWWLSRIARGGQVVAPGPRDLGIQYVDVRDMAAWMLDAAGAGLGGPYDIVCPAGRVTMGELLETCNDVTGGGAELRWIDPEPILAAGVAPWIELPVWLPPGEDHAFIHESDVSKALAAGLRCRPLRETVAGTWSWLQSRHSEPPQRPGIPPHGLPPEKERELLSAR